MGHKTCIDTIWCVYLHYIHQSTTALSINNINPTHEVPNNALGNMPCNTDPDNQLHVCDEAASMNQGHVIHWKWGFSLLWSKWKCHWHEWHSAGEAGVCGLPLIIIITPVLIDRYKYYFNIHFQGPNVIGGCMP